MSTTGKQDGRTNPRKRRLSWRWMALAALVLLPVLAAVLLIDRDPLVIEVERLTTERATEARGLADRIRSELLLATEQPQELVVSEDELNGLAALAKRAAPWVSGRANITPFAMLGALSVRIPGTPFGSYVNLLVEVAPSSDGIRFYRLRIGSVTLPASFARPMTRLVFDVLLGWGNGRALVDMIESVSLASGRATIRLRPIPDFAARMEEIRDRFRRTRDEAIRVSDADTVKVYYDQLAELASFTGPQDRLSLAMYLSPLFELAALRSRESSAVEENRAAIMALAIFLGSQRFQLFTGPVVPSEGVRKPGRTSKTTLADRVDSRLHFVYSAALKLASDSGASFALGEFKEMLDAGQGGSGFSFADLAADRAGIRFAEEATSSEARARRLQSLMAAEMSELLFFPSLEGLTEGIAGGEFERDYSGLDSPAYRAAIAEIDRRLAALPLYR